MKYKNRSKAFSKIVNIVITLTISIFGYLSITPSRLQAAGGSIYFANIPEQVAVGETFSTKIMIDSAGQDVSTVIVEFTYPSDILEFVEIDTTQSVFESNGEGDIETPGKIAFTRYTLSESYYNGTGSVATVTFRKIKDEEATLTFTDETALLNTNVTLPEDIIESKESVTVSPKPTSTSLTDRIDLSNNSTVLIIVGICLISFVVVIIYLVVRKKQVRTDDVSVLEESESSEESKK